MRMHGDRRQGDWRRDREEASVSRSSLRQRHAGLALMLAAAMATGATRRGPPFECMGIAGKATGAGIVRKRPSADQVFGSVTPVWPWYLPPRSP